MFHVGWNCNGTLKTLCSHIDGDVWLSGIDYVLVELRGDCPLHLGPHKQIQRTLHNSTSSEILNSIPKGVCHLIIRIHGVHAKHDRLEHGGLR